METVSMPLPTLSEMERVLPDLTAGVREDLRLKFKTTGGKSLLDVNEAMKRHSLIVGKAFLARMREQISMDEFLGKITQQLAVFAGMRYHLLDVLSIIPAGDAEADEGRSILLEAEQELAGITENFLKEVQKLASKDEERELVWSAEGFRMVERFPFTL